MAKKKKTNKKRIKARKIGVIKKSRKKSLAKLKSKKIRKSGKNKVKSRNRKKILKKAKKKKIRKSLSRKKNRQLKKKKTRRNRKILKRKSVKKLVKQEKPAAKVDFPAEAFFKTRIKVIGIGGGGSSIVSEIGRSLNKATFVIADTDTRAFRKRRGIKYLQLGRELTHGLGTGMNPGLARLAAEQEKIKITELFKDQNIIIFIASLGGGMGSGATPAFVEAAQNFDGITFGIFTLPFKFEGNNKQKVAYRALYELRKSLNVSITIPNERIFKVINSDTAVTEAFSIVNKTLIESLESLIDLIYNPGVINVDFADLKSILNGRGNSAFLNTAQASGKDRLKKIIKDILYNPLYRNNNFTAQKILFNIQGGSDLSMFEVEKISKTISERNPRAKIIFGISKNPKYKNKIKAILLMTGSSFATSGQAKVKSINPSKTSAKPKKKMRKRIRNPLSAPAFENKEKISLTGALSPVLNNAPVNLDLRRLSVFEANKPETSVLHRVGINSHQPKKTIRRTALEIKKAEEVEGKKISEQEKEWDIPAFLRKVKFKP